MLSVFFLSRQNCEMVKLGDEQVEDGSQTGYLRRIKLRHRWSLFSVPQLEGKILIPIIVCVLLAIFPALSVDCTSPAGTAGRRLLCLLLGRIRPPVPGWYSHFGYGEEDPTQGASAEISHFLASLA